MDGRPRRRLPAGASGRYGAVRRILWGGDRVPTTTRDPQAADPGSDRGAGVCGSRSPVVRVARRVPARVDVARLRRHGLRRLHPATGAPGVLHQRLGAGRGLRSHLLDAVAGMVEDRTGPSRPIPVMRSAAGEPYTSGWQTRARVEVVNAVSDSSDRPPSLAQTQ